ncbi:hypothetical protein [Ureibacillus sp. GCM10028918]|uniref:hypothetical protein n=1 Tax=Ureibacillus sp. GCM10028918 TaxID=3273429 RepID=UPI00360D2D71
MKNQLLRISSIIVLGLLVYINAYEKDELGLTAFFAYFEMLFFAFLIGIPIIFIRNKIRLWSKIGLLFLSTFIIALIPPLGFGNLKYVLEDNLLENDVEKIENLFNVDLQKDSVYLTFDNHLLVTKYKEIGGITDESLMVYDSSGKIINQLSVSELAKAVLPYLPLTEKEKETTYFDGMYTSINNYDLFKKIGDNKITFGYRYVTHEVPENFIPEPDMPSDVKDLKFHYNITYSPSLDASGNFVFDSDTIDADDDDPLASYVAEGIEAIVAPNTAVLVSEIK